MQSQHHPLAVEHQSIGRSGTVERQCRECLITLGHTFRRTISIEVPLLKGQPCDNWTVSVLTFQQYHFCQELEKRLKDALEIKKQYKGKRQTKTGERWRQCNITWGHPFLQCHVCQGITLQITSPAHRAVHVKMGCPLAGK